MRSMSHAPGVHVVALVPAAGPVPPPGAEVLTADDKPRKIGQITSAAVSYATDQPVALSYLKRSYDSPGLEVAVLLAGGAAPGQVFWPANA